MICGIHFILFFFLLSVTLFIIVQTQNNSDVHHQEEAVNSDKDVYWGIIKVTQSFAGWAEIQMWVYLLPFFSFLRPTGNFSKYHLNLYIPFSQDSPVTKTWMLQDFLL